MQSAQIITKADAKTILRLHKQLGGIVDQLTANGHNLRKRRKKVKARRKKADKPAAKVEKPAKASKKGKVQLTETPDE